MAEKETIKTEEPRKPTPRTYLISSEHLMGIMKYLMTRPYGEVVKLMNSLASLSPLDPRIAADFVKAQKGDQNGGKK